jgi:hypothetical protein
MKLAVVHLSDIHFRTRKDVCLRRADKLANAIKYAHDPEEKLLFVVTGDIANTGSSEEYQIAGEFFRPLFIGLGIDPAADPSETIFIPGNHDCNFRESGDLRPRLLENIQVELENIKANGETVRSLLQVQTEFFKFQEELTGRLLAPESKLYFSRKFEIGGKTLEFLCFNSAWLSSRHEDPGTLGTR